MAQAKQPKTRPEDKERPQEVRCTCGALIARARDGWVEVRCRRCKQGIRLRWDAGALVVEEAAS